MARLGAVLAWLFATLVHAQAAGVLDDLETFEKTYRQRSVYIEVFSDVAATQPIDTGSGVLLQSGYVLTSLHVLTGPEAPFRQIGEIFVKGRVGYTEGVPAAKLTLVGKVEDHDLALLQFNPAVSQDFAYACPRFSRVKMGEDIALLGFPLRQDLVFDVGKVNGLEANLIKTTMVSAPGHSGSGVYDRNGLLIGIARGELRLGAEAVDLYVIVPISRATSLINIVETEEDGGCSGLDPTTDQAVEVARSAEVVALSLGPEATASIDESLSLGQLQQAKLQLASAEAELDEQRRHFRGEARQLLELMAEGGFTFGGVVYPNLRWAKDVITICFFNGSQQERSVVANIANQWTLYGDIEFDFGSVFNPRTCQDGTFSDVRISFDPGPSSSSLGSRSAAGDQAVASMRLNLRQDSPSLSFAASVLHEFGHMLGLGHQLTHPGFCRDELDLEFIYADLGRRGMTKEQIDRNLFLSSDVLKELGRFDAKSVMNFIFPAQYYLAGRDSPCFVGQITGLSALDKLTMYHLYPFEEDEDHAAIQ